MGRPSSTRSPRHVVGWSISDEMDQTRKELPASGCAESAGRQKVLLRFPSMGAEIDTQPVGQDGDDGTGRWTAHHG